MYVENELSQLRISIDNLDAAIVVLLAERFRITDQRGLVKAKAGLEPRDEAREEELLRKSKELAAQHNLNPDIVSDVLTMIVSEVKKRHAKTIERFYRTTHHE